MPCLRKAMTTSRKQPVFMAEMRLSFTHRFHRLLIDFLDVCQLVEKTFFDKLPAGLAPCRFFMYISELSAEAAVAGAG